MIPHVRSSPSSRSTSITGRRVAVVALAVCALLAVAATGAVTAQSDQPAVVVTDATTTTGDTTTVGIVLTTAPDGLAGYYLDVSVETAGTARIESASYPDRFGLTTEPQVSDDGATVTLEAADMEGAIEPGATDVTLATVELAGAASGDTELTVRPRQFDADTGEAFQPATQAGTVTVTGATDSTAAADSSASEMDDSDGASQQQTPADGDESTRTTTPAPTTGFGTLSTTLVGVAFAVLTLGALWRRD
ncbi:cell surface protein [Haloplanus sp. C73]|uniref:cell surface protein n=1 Tax=Haloplanus sp. C73 TaxID=3421641 RepID=UPI003EB89CB7